MLLVLMVLVARAACGQYPLTRTIAVRDGQQGVQVSCMAQDSLGLLWLGARAAFSVPMVTAPMPHCALTMMP